MVQAQIDSIQGKGDWQGKYGTMYTFEVSFNDGTVGEANSKTAEPPYKVGDEVWYEVKGENQYGKKLKISKSGPDAQFRGAPSNPNKDKEIRRGMCLKVAAMAWGGAYKHKEFTPDHHTIVKDVITMAKLYEKAFEEWLNE